MNIEIHQPRLEALIQQRMASGQFESIEDLLLHTLETSPAGDGQQITEDSQDKPKKQNLADFLLNSPLHGSGLVVERSKDAPRIIEFDSVPSCKRTGADIVAAMQKMPYKDTDIEPSRPHLPVRDVTL